MAASHAGQKTYLHAITIKTTIKIPVNAICTGMLFNRPWFLLSLCVVMAITSLEAAISNGGIRGARHDEQKGALI